MSNDRLIGVNNVTITFVWNFQEKAHSGRTTLMLKEKKRTQSNKEATFSGQSTWISCKRDQKWVTWQEKKASVGRGGGNNNTDFLYSMVLSPKFWHGRSGNTEDLGKEGLARSILARVIACSEAHSLHALEPILCFHWLSLLSWVEAPRVRT